MRVEQAHDWHRIWQDSQTLSGGRNHEDPVVFRKPGILGPSVGQLEGSEDRRILAKPGLRIRETEAS
jgi:hypothetical protein